MKQENSKWFVFRYNTWPNFLNTVTLWQVRNELLDYWYLNISKQKPIWVDADETQCYRWLACRYCGKGKIHETKT